ncbi:MAG: PqqD family protein [Actinomycetota bacterium]|nr:PqqD family protein [Actinomycetota bacterium]
MTADTHFEAVPALPLHTVLAHGEVQWAAAGAEVVVAQPAHAVAHVLDPASAVLWQCLDGASPLTEVIADIAEAFGVTAEQVAADCVPVLRSWLAAGIVHEGPADDQRATSPAPLERAWRRLVDPPDT